MIAAVLQQLSPVYCSYPENRDVQTSQIMSRDFQSSQTKSRDFQTCQIMSRDIKPCPEISSDLKPCQDILYHVQTFQIMSIDVLRCPETSLAAQSSLLYMSSSWGLKYFTWIDWYLKDEHGRKVNIRVQGRKLWSSWGRMHMKNEHDWGPTSFCLMRTPLVLRRPDCIVKRAGCK